MLAVISPFMIPLAAAVIGLDYLRRQLLPEVPTTEPVGEPYTPPFEGGQCLTTYILKVSFVIVATGERITPYDALTVSGKIESIEPFNNENSTSGVRVRHGGGVATVSGSSSFYRDYEVNDIRRSDGQADSCGNLPNPNPAPSVGSDGIATSPAPVYDGDDSLVLGAPLVALPSIAPAIQALAAAAAAAGSALAAAVEVAKALEKVGDFLEKLKDYLEDKDKEDDTKKALFKHDYGSIRKDGFLRLYPIGEIDGFKPVYVDLQLLSIPIGYGKYFGQLSPNFYRFKSLGYISFVSSSFGILETREIEFSRTSLNVPDNAYGFFYHLGLEDAIRANVSLFYLKTISE